MPNCGFISGGGAAKYLFTMSGATDVSLNQEWTLSHSGGCLWTDSTNAWLLTAASGLLNLSRGLPNILYTASIGGWNGSSDLVMAKAIGDGMPSTITLRVPGGGGGSSGGGGTVTVPSGPSGSSAVASTGGASTTEQAQPETGVVGIGNLSQFQPPPGQLNTPAKPNAPQPVVYGVGVGAMAGMAALANVPFASPPPPPSIPSNAPLGQKMAWVIQHYNHIARLYNIGAISAGDAYAALVQLETSASGLGLQLNISNFTIYEMANNRPIRPFSPGPLGHETSRPPISIRPIRPIRPIPEPVFVGTPIASVPTMPIIRPVPPGTLGPATSSIPPLPVPPSTGAIIPSRPDIVLPAPGPTPQGISGPTVGALPPGAILTLPPSATGPTSISAPGLPPQPVPGTIVEIPIRGPGGLTTGYITGLFGENGIITHIIMPNGEVIAVTGPGTLPTPNPSVPPAMHETPPLGPRETVPSTRPITRPPATTRPTPIPTSPGGMGPIGKIGGPILIGLTPVLVSGPESSPDPLTGAIHPGTVIPSNPFSPNPLQVIGGTTGLWNPGMSPETHPGFFIPPQAGMPAPIPPEYSPLLAPIFLPGVGNQVGSGGTENLPDNRVPRPQVPRMAPIVVQPSMPNQIGTGGTENLPDMRPRPPRGASGGW